MSCFRAVERLQEAYDAYVPVKVKAAIETIPAALRAIRGVMPSRGEVLVGAVSMAAAVPVSALLSADTPTMAETRELWKEIAAVPAEQRSQDLLNLGFFAAAITTYGVAGYFLLKHQIPRMSSQTKVIIVDNASTPLVPALVKQGTILLRNIIADGMPTPWIAPGVVADSARKAFGASVANHPVAQVIVGAIILDRYYEYVIEGYGEDQVETLSLYDHLKRWNYYRVGEYVLPMAGSLLGGAVAGPAGAVAGGLGSRIIFKTGYTFFSPFGRASRQSIVNAFRYRQQVERQKERRACHEFIRNLLQVYSHPRERVSQDHPYRLVIDYAGPPVQGALRPEQPMRGA